MLYVASVNNPDSLGLALADPKRTDMGYVGGGGRGAAAGRGGAPAPVMDENTPRVPPKVNMGPGGLPLVKPPWGRIVAIDLNKGDIAWTIPNGDPPDYVKGHPLLKGIDIGKTGRPSRATLMLTKTLLFSA